jgi:hypothetical protein
MPRFPRVFLESKFVLINNGLKRKENMRMQAHVNALIRSPTHQIPCSTDRNRNIHKKWTTYNLRSGLGEGGENIKFELIAQQKSMRCINMVRNN